MTLYIPGDSPQALGSRVIGNSYTVMQLKDYRTFGPPPSNYYSARYQEKNLAANMFYAYYSVDNTVKTKAKGGSWNHPCSPAILMAIRPPKFDPEFVVNRKPRPGFFDPPMKCVLGQILLKHQPTWEAAIAAAMGAKGINFDIRAINQDDIKVRVNTLFSNPIPKKELRHHLYHPTD